MKSIKDYQSIEGYEMSIGIYTEFIGEQVNYFLRLIKSGHSHGFGLLEKYNSLEDADAKRNLIAKSFELKEVIY